MTTEQLSKWSSIAEIASSIAILATLIFIVVELRQNSQAVRDTALQNLDAGVMNIDNLWSSSEEISVLLMNGWNDFGELSEEQQIHFSFLMNAGYLRMDTSWWANRNGLLPDELWERERAVLEEWLGTEGGRRVWATTSVSASFRRYVEQNLLPRQE